ncbi:MAG: glycosyltransferase [Gammaproteobacteria bacterium]|nr:MAG: glycosyltransferase [Gammaproteobacteria bacterium]
MTAARRVSRLRRIAFQLRFLPLYGAMLAADWLAGRLPLRWPRGDHARRFKPGISVIVPERGTPDLLVHTLGALAAACTQVDEPVQVIIVVNGAPSESYADLRAAHPTFEWQFHDIALGYNGAICTGLDAVRNDWVYLLNSDMRLDARALAELLPYRRANLFAITSQIFFEDATRRREETGWSDFHPNTETPEVYEREPEPGALARGNFYAGGGSSLFQTRLLHRYARESQVYNPFYWEDADWGLRAWHEGHEVLFCPASQAWHQHRGTVKRYYAEGEVQRVIARNAQWFDIRHARSKIEPIEHIRRIAAREPEHWREFSGLHNAWITLRLRLAARRAELRELPYKKIVTHSFYGARTTDLLAPLKPRVLLVSPFALFPPSHGGARRVAELVMRLSDRIDFILLSDERSLYSIKSEPWLRHVLATHLVEGRGDRSTDAPLTLLQRMQRHAWPELRIELERLVALYDPDIVQVEFMELALLADQRASNPESRARWLLALHDVYLRGNNGDRDDAAQIAAIARFDAVIACSREDLDLLQHPDRTLIGNGSPDRRAGYLPSPQTPPQLLFMGPFRYAQNREGIVEFLDTAWPKLKTQFPDLRITILGGVESAALVAIDARLRQDGVETISAFVDPAAYLQNCTLSINPQNAIRGSSIKLIESLLAGRVCVSTADGTRGFGDAGFDDLVVAPTIAAMAEPIAALIADPARRRRLERADDVKLDRYTWDAIASQQFGLYQRLIGKR